MENPSQWPEISNFSMHVAGEVKRRHEELSNLVRGIQRWWRWRRERPASGQPPLSADGIPTWHIRGRKRVYTLFDVASTVRAPLFPRDVIGTEKLDGTNFGVNCQGLVVGRRQVVTGDTYQKVKYAGEVPNQAAVQAARERICGLVPPLGDGLETLYLYGELIPRGGKQKEFPYESRDLLGRWLCFGASLTLQGGADPLPISESLTVAGFWHSVGEGRITLAYSRALVGVLEGVEGLKMVPTLQEGPLTEVVGNLKEAMMDNGQLEGVVFNSDGWRSKWKTGKEDVSQGGDQLQEALPLAPFIGLKGGANVPLGYSIGGPLPAGGAEVMGECYAMVKVMVDVVTNRPEKKAPKSKGEKAAKTPKEDPIPARELDEKLESALTKFNSIASYFDDTPLEEGQKPGATGRAVIMHLLIEEVTSDTAEVDNAKKLQIKRAIGKKVGEEFKEWQFRQNQAD